MNWTHDFTQAAVIMVLGMSVTFIFLALLILIIQVSSKIIARYAIEPEPAPRAAIPCMQSKDDGAVIAAITMAVKKYHNYKNAKI